MWSGESQTHGRSGMSLCAKGRDSSTFFHRPNWAASELAVELFGFVDAKLAAG